MKHALFYEIMRKLKSKPALRRKLKIFAVVGVTCFLVVGGLAIWAGVSAIKYVATSTNQVISSPTTQEQIQNAKTELQKLQFQPLNCWGKAQSLLAVQPWLERRALDNLKNLKVACLESKPAACEEAVCPQTKEQMNTAEGRSI
jgi:hypothetical protein